MNKRDELAREKLEEGLDNFGGTEASPDPRFSEQKKSGKFDPKNPWDNCTVDHPPLKLTVCGKSVQIYGSSCITPIFEADVFISLDHQAPVYEFEQPWSKNTKVQTHIRYFIEDFGVPESFKSFDACLDYTLDQLNSGKNVHVGCLGGHGRTGTFLTGLAQKAMGDKFLEQDISAIDYVRDNYCAKAVETIEQVIYLHAHLGVKIPDIELDEVMEIKKEFKRHIGVHFDKVISLGEYDACREVITEISSMVSKANSPVLEDLSGENNQEIKSNITLHLKNK